MPDQTKDPKQEAAKVAADVKDELGKLKGELQQLAGEIKVKVHLASMDVKDSWNEIEPRLRQFEQDVSQKAGKAASVTSTELKAAAQDLKARAKKIRDALG